MTGKDRTEQMEQNRPGKTEQTGQGQDRNRQDRRVDCRDLSPRNLMCCERVNEQLTGGSFQVHKVVHFTFLRE
jgi:hypothetical protein